jgi:hypothetical protein
VRKDTSRKSDRLKQRKQLPKQERCLFKLTMSLLSLSENASYWRREKSANTLTFTCQGKFFEQTGLPRKAAIPMKMQLEENQLIISFSKPEAFLKEKAKE